MILSVDMIAWCPLKLKKTLCLIQFFKVYINNWVRPRSSEALLLFQICSNTIAMQTNILENTMHFWFNVYFWMISVPFRVYWAFRLKTRSRLDIIIRLFLFLQTSLLFSVSAISESYNTQDLQDIAYFCSILKVWFPFSEWYK